MWQIATIAVTVIERTGFEAGFRHAGRALEVALRLGANGLFDLDALGLRPAAVDDADVGDAIVRRYLEPLAGSTGEVILATVERFSTTTPTSRRPRASWAST